MSVEKLWDELCIGVKCQSNVEIAGSPRNSFRASLRRHITNSSQTANGFMRRTWESECE